MCSGEEVFKISYLPRYLWYLGTYPYLIPRVKKYQATAVVVAAPIVTKKTWAPLAREYLSVCQNGNFQSLFNVLPNRAIPFTNYSIFSSVIRIRCKKAKNSFLGWFFWFVNPCGLGSFSTYSIAVWISGYADHLNSFSSSCFHETSHAACWWYSSFAFTVKLCNFMYLKLA